MSNIKRCFESRWGAKGVLLEADYSQIEVVVQAFLSNDTQMKEDVRNGIDFHCKRLAYKLKEDYEAVFDLCHKYKDAKYVKLRKQAKVFSFRKAYGAGPAAIAEAIGGTLAEAKEFFAIEEAMYPEIAKMQQMWLDAVEQSKMATSLRTKKGFSACRGFLKSVTGKRYVFTEEDIPTGMQTRWVDGRQEVKRVGFKPTTIKNYPIQGLAGELLYIALGKLARGLLCNGRLRDRCLLVNTVHDSIIFDVHMDVLSEAIDFIKYTMQNVPTYFEEWFGTPFDLPLGVEIKMGKNWLDMEVVA